MPRGRKPSYSWPPRRPSKPSPSPTAGASFLAPNTLHNLWNCSKRKLKRLRRKRSFGGGAEVCGDGHDKSLHVLSGFNERGGRRELAGLIATDGLYGY